MFCCRQWGHSGLQEAQEDLVLKEVVILENLLIIFYFGTLLLCFGVFIEEEKKNNKLEVFQLL